jgi:signal transduction histidine kinase
VQESFLAVFLSWGSVLFLVTLIVLGLAWSRLGNWIGRTWILSAVETFLHLLWIVYLASLITSLVLIFSSSQNPWVLGSLLGPSLGFVIWLVAKVRKAWDPMINLESKELQEFQAWIAERNDSKQMLQDVIELAEGRGYRKVGGILLKKTPLKTPQFEASFGASSDLENRKLLRLLRERKSVIIKGALKLHLRKMVEPEQKRKVLGDFKFLSRLNRQIWIPLPPGREDLVGGIWMNEPKRPLIRSKQEHKILRGLAGLVGGRLVLIQTIQNHQREAHLAGMGLMTASLAHELKNPLASIMGAAKLIQKKPENSENFLPIVIEESERMNTLLKLFLGWAKEIEAQLIEVDLVEYINKWFEYSTWLDHEKYGRSRVYIEPIESKVVLQVDSVLLNQILDNLVKNGLEHSDLSGIVKIKVVGLEECVEIWVQDEGDGVAEPDLLFQPFQSSKADGHGLGLAFSLKAARSMGGDLRYSKTKIDGECGACFVLSLNLNSGSKEIIGKV